MLTSERLLLRAVEPSDVDFLFKEENKTDIWNLSGTLIPFSRNTLMDYANSVHDIISQKQFRFIIEVKGLSLPIGMIDLFDYDVINSRVGIGIIITNQEFRNKGLAKEALHLILAYCQDILHLNQVHCSILENNAESIGLFESIGFSSCGIRKDWYKTQINSWQNELLYQYIFS
jgi:diamine N-acetyltransferase